MLQLESAKCSFLFCLGICIFTCTIIYIKAGILYTPTALSRLNGHPFPAKCQALLDNSSYTTWQSVDDLDIRYFDGPSNCSRMQTDLHFIMEPLSREEADYPLAFIITIHKELEMFVRLLRAIYAPQNIYCIHVDGKAPENYKRRVRRLAGCFPNVFLASVSERVTYAGFSRLKADINCMEDLLKSPVQWKKVLNLCGQEFPIKSNLELIQYMQRAEWRDINMTPGVKQPEHIRHRTEIQHVEVEGDHVASKGQGHRKDPPPHNLQIYFGTAYYSLTRAFVEYVLNSYVAKDLLEWSKDTYSPDEHYWVTLNHVKGHYVRDICIYDTEDIPWIIEKNSMFANKFESTIFPEALDCLEQWHRHKVLQQATVPIQSSWHLAIKVNGSSAITVG